jgi:hypothetical protein
MSILSVAVPLCRGETFFLGTATKRRCFSVARILLLRSTCSNELRKLDRRFRFWVDWFCCFIYGKRMNLWKIMLCGLVLMISLISSLMP